MRPLIILALAVLAIACSSSPAQPELDPVFVLMCDDIDPEEPPHPCCTGFAHGGQVVTANHCVPGDEIRIVSREQWVNTASDSSIGHVVARDEGRDIAWLSAPVDAQLDRGGPIVAGAAISALTMSVVVPGKATQQGGYFWITDLDVIHSDSGSAIVDAHGDAIGVLTNCRMLDGDKQCKMSTGIFAELP